MPGRNIPLATGQIYHVLNRGIASQPIFLNKRNYQRALETIFFYQNKNLPLSYSGFSKLSSELRENVLKKLRKERKFLVEIIAFCLMPNHFHLLLKQVEDGGISLFTGQVSNSYTRYFNTFQKRIGPIFQGKFKAVRVETNEQLLHVNRYLHLNPYSSFLVKNLKDLETYPYSSLPEYLNLQDTDYCQKEIILDQFKNASELKKFIFDQADYQRRLEVNKHLFLEK